VQALAADGLPARMVDGRRLVAARPCLHVWGATLPGTVLYPGDGEVLDALRALRASAAEPARLAAEANLEAMAAAAAGG
jgi:hypothetical protein